jgi:tetratricopeptide (TPR) repeat protein
MTERLAYLQKLSDEDPEDSFLIYAIAKEWEKDDLVKASEVFEQLQAKDPDYTGLYYQLGKVYEKRGMFAEAVHIYQEGIKTAKSQSDFHSLAELNTAKTNLEIEMDF